MPPAPVPDRLGCGAEIIRSDAGFPLGTVGKPMAEQKCPFEAHDCFAGNNCFSKHHRVMGVWLYYQTPFSAFLVKASLPTGRPVQWMIQNINGCNASDVGSVAADEEATPLAQPLMITGFETPTRRLLKCPNLVSLCRVN
jgi:hypothetical protein